MSDYVSIFGNVACRDEDFDDFDAEVVAEKAIFDRKLENMRQDRNSLARDMVNIHWVLGKILDLSKTPDKEDEVCEAISDLYFKVGMWVEWAKKNDIVNKKSDQLIASAPFAKADPVIKPTNG